MDEDALKTLADKISEGTATIDEKVLFLQGVNASLESLRALLQNSKS